MPLPRRFATTRWSLVLHAGSGDGETARLAREELCQLYWYPLYAYLRREGQPPEDAQDLTQAFFCDFLAREDLSRAEPERGRFRSYLLASLRNFVRNEAAAARAHKRGGGQPVLSLEWERGEARYQIEPVDLASPEHLFLRSWALTMLDQALTELQAEQEQKGHGAIFAALKPQLEAGAHAPDYASLATALDQTPGALKVRVHRLRQRFAELLREAVAGTVEDPADVEAEMQDLEQALGRPG